MSEAIQHYLDQHAALKGSLPGNELTWLSASREQALQEFSKQGFPHHRLEDWKYTSIRPIEKRQFKLAETTDHTVDAASLSHYLCKDMACHLMVFVDGRFSAPLSNLGTLPDGVKIKDITTALKEDTELVQTHLGSAADISRNGFAAMNMAFMSDGVFVELHKNTKVELPIHLMFLSSGKQEEVTSQARILILAGQGSQAKIIESYQALGNSVYFNNITALSAISGASVQARVKATTKTNITTEIKLAANANIEHYKVQQESNKAFHIATLQVDQQRDSTFTSHSVSLGAQLARNDINSWMGDEGATCNLNGLYVTEGRQHCDFHTRIDHANAQKSDAQQSNKNLLLSKDAEVDTKPQLEIYADDVTASHGATVGQLDQNMMFYLRSRGIDYNAAHALLVYGFARSVIEKMSLEPLQKHLEMALVNRIPNAGQFSDMV